MTTADPLFSLAAAKARYEARGRKVREIWIEWAKEQPDPKPSWLVPYDELSEADQLVDNSIGAELYGDGFLDGVNFGLKTANEIAASGQPEDQPDSLKAKFAEDIAIWLRVLVSEDWQADSEAILMLANHLAQVVENETSKIQL